jgi:alpha-tubulin suppressor-like RCC1 family protein
LLKNNGDVWAAGNDASGQLGNGITTTTNQTRSIPSLRGANIIAFEAGTSTSMAVDSTGALWSTGSDSSGALGNGGTSANINTWTAVTLGVGVVATKVSTCSNSALVLDNTGNVWGAGFNSQGQLGIANTTSQQSFVSHASVAGNTAPGGISNGVVITDISVGAQHSLYLDSTGRVWGSGADANGRLGGIGNQTIPTLIPITGNPTIVAVSAGFEHSLFLDNTGQVWACGRNAQGELGVATTTTQITVPTLITGLTNIARISGGRYYSLFLDVFSNVFGLGHNASGQLGLGAGVTNVTTAGVGAAIPGITNCIYIAASRTGSHSLFIDNTNRVFSTGVNTTGQLGIGNTTNATTLTPLI